MHAKVLVVAVQTCCNISFCAAEMMLSLSQPDGDRITSLSLLVRIYYIVHPHRDISTHLIRTNELNDIFCEFV